MSTVAVIAHSGKTLDGGLPELRKVLERQGAKDVLWYEVPKSRLAPKQLPRHSRKAPTWSSSGAATEWSSGASTSSRARKRRWRSCRQAPRTCSPRTSAYRSTSTLRSRSASRQASEARCRPHERRKVRRHGRRRLRRTRDPRRDHEDEAHARAQRLRVGSCEEPSREGLRAQRSRSTGRSGTRARRASSSSAMSAKRSPA